MSSPLNLGPGQRFAIFSSSKKGGERCKLVKMREEKGLFGIFGRKWIPVEESKGFKKLYEKLPDLLGNLRKLSRGDQRDLFRALVTKRAFSKVKGRRWYRLGGDTELRKIKECWKVAFESGLLKEIESRETFLDLFHEAVAMGDKGAIREVVHGGTAGLASLEPGDLEELLKQLMSSKPDSSVVLPIFQSAMSREGVEALSVFVKNRDAMRSIFVAEKGRLTAPVDPRYLRTLLGRIIVSEPTVATLLPALEILDAEQNGLYASFPGGVREAVNRLHALLLQKSHKREGEDLDAFLGSLMREAFPYKLRKMMHVPISPDTRETASRCLEEMRQLPGDLSKKKLLSSEQFLYAMCRDSTTIKSGGEGGRKALENFMKAMEGCIDLAASHRASKGKISLKEILEMNQGLCYGLRNNGGRAGEFRTADICVAGAVGFVGKDAVLYLPTEKVDAEMESFMKWLHRAIDLCDREQGNPVILATSVFRRLVSIHPFCDGNGRTTRMLVNYILLRYNLPPADFGERGDQNFASFPGDFTGRLTVKSDDALKKMVEGVRRGGSVLKTSGSRGMKGLEKLCGFSTPKSRVALFSDPDDGPLFADPDDDIE